MARKNTLKCTEIVKKEIVRTPMYALKTYWVFAKDCKDPIYVTANEVEHNDNSLVFKIVYEGNDTLDESEEIVSIFNEFDYFVLSSAEAAKI